ncbi:hypothetical protein D3C81_1769430 [compost metagenome]
MPVPGPSPRADCRGRGRSGRINGCVRFPECRDRYLRLLSYQPSAIPGPGLFPCTDRHCAAGCQSQSRPIPAVHRPRHLAAHGIAIPPVCRPAVAGSAQFRVLSNASATIASRPACPAIAITIAARRPVPMLRWQRGVCVRPPPVHPVLPPVWFSIILTRRA